MAMILFLLTQIKLYLKRCINSSWIRNVSKHIILSNGKRLVCMLISVSNGNLCVWCDCCSESVPPSHNFRYIVRVSLCLSVCLSLTLSLCVSLSLLHFFFYVLNSPACYNEEIIFMFYLINWFNCFDNYVAMIYTRYI